MAADRSARDVLAQALYDHAVEKARSSINEMSLSCALDKATVEQLARESDRSLAIVLYAIIDDLAKDIIYERLNTNVNDVKNRVFGAFGFLPNSTSRLLFLLSFKWISDETYHNANLLRKIRNAFAHEPDCFDFSCQRINGYLSSISPTHEYLISMLLEVANSTDKGQILPPTVAIDEYRKRRRFFFLVEGASLFERILTEMILLPEADRYGVHPRSIVGSFDETPEALKKLKYASADLIIQAVVTAFNDERLTDVLTSRS